MKRLLWVLAAFGASEAAAQSDPAFSANPVAVTTGESVSPETLHRTDTATRDAAQTVAGWIKTFAAEPIEAGAPFEAPDYLGTLIEAAVRGDLEQRLAAMGFNPAPAESDGLITLSVSITEPKPKTRGLPKSPVRLEGVDNDPTDNIHDPEVRPYIALAEGKPPPPSTPMIKVTLYARRGDTRVWSGYAGAPAIGGSREEIARSLAAALIAHFGQTADLPDTEIALTAAAGELPILERH